MVTPVRGPGGGYRLALNAQDIAVSQVAAAVEPHQTEDLEPADKSGQTSPVEDMTLGLAGRVHEVEQLFLDQVSLADVLKSYKERQQRTVRLHRPSVHSEAYRYSDTRLGEEAAIHP
jgi:DNA-binding IscR family transcriptional regulator